MIETGLNGKTVVVTGAASGIGRATAVRFAREGSKVVGWDVKAAIDGEFEHEMRQAGGEGIYQRVDVTRADEVEEAVSRVLASCGRIHVLVNNAGILNDGQLVKYKEGEIRSVLSDEAFDRVLEVNLKGVFLCARAVVPHMIRNGGGVILNASSVVALYGNFGQTNYIASKAGVIGMTRVWARELGRYGIRVNAVAPGFIATEMIGSMPEKVLDMMRQRTPLGRLGNPEEVAEAYLWLASDAASFITGHTLSVDGGVVVGT